MQSPQVHLNYISAPSNFKRCWAASLLLMRCTCARPQPNTSALDSRQDSHIIIVRSRRPHVARPCVRYKTPALDGHLCTLRYRTTMWFINAMTPSDWDVVLAEETILVLLPNETDGGARTLLPRAAWDFTGPAKWVSTCWIFNIKSALVFRVKNFFSWDRMYLAVTRLVFKRDKQVRPRVQCHEFWINQHSHSSVLDTWSYLRR